jgi:hypothetical protein
VPGSLTTQLFAARQLRSARTPQPWPSRRRRTRPAGFQRRLPRWLGRHTATARPDLLVQVTNVNQRAARTQRSDSPVHNGTRRLTHRPIIADSPGGCSCRRPRPERRKASFAAARSVPQVAAYRCHSYLRAFRRPGRRGPVHSPCCWPVVPGGILGRGGGLSGLVPVTRHGQARRAGQQHCPDSRGWRLGGAGEPQEEQRGHSGKPAAHQNARWNASASAPWCAAMARGRPRGRRRRRDPASSRRPASY